MSEQTINDQQITSTNYQVWDDGDVWDDIDWWDGYTIEQQVIDQQI